MLRGLIQNLRRKPKMLRDNIALGAAGTLTAAVLVGWLVIDGPTPINVGEVVAEGEEGVGAFSTLFGEIKDQAAALGEVLPEVLPTEESDEAPSDISMEESSAKPVESVYIESTTTNSVESPQVIRIATTSSEIEN